MNYLTKRACLAGRAPLPTILLSSADAEIVEVKGVVLYWELFAALLPTRTKPTLFTPLSAMTRLPSGVDFMLRTTPPPPGIIQLWNFSVLISNRTSTFGRIADSTYQMAPLR